MFIAKINLCYLREDLAQCLADSEYSKVTLCLTLYPCPPAPILSPYFWILKSLRALRNKNRQNPNCKIRMAWLAWPASCHEIDWFARSMFSDSNTGNGRGGMNLKIKDFFFYFTSSHKWFISTWNQFWQCIFYLQMIFWSRRGIKIVIFGICFFFLLLGAQTS